MVGSDLSQPSANRRRAVVLCIVGTFCASWLLTQPSHSTYPRPVMEALSLSMDFANSGFFCVPDDERFLLA